MKKKIYKYLTVAVVAVAMAVSFQMSRAIGATTLTIENIITLAIADWEWGVELYKEDTPICGEFEDDGVIYYYYETNCWSGGSDECEEEACII